MKNLNTVEEVDDGEALLGMKTLRPLVGNLSESTISRRVEDGTFPRPVVLGRSRKGRPTRIAWVKREVLQWCREQIESSRA